MNIQNIFLLLTNNCKSIIPVNKYSDDKLKININIPFYNDIIFDDKILISFNYNLINYKNMKKLLPNYFIKSDWIFYFEINNQYEFNSLSSDSMNNLYFFLNINKYSDNYNKLFLTSDNLGNTSDEYPKIMDVFKYFDCIKMNFKNQFKIINNNLYFIGSTKKLQKKFLVYYLFLSSFNNKLYDFLNKLRCI